MATIGADLDKTTVLMDDAVRVRVCIWDTGGSEKFGSITKNYISSLDGIIVAFSLTSLESYQSLSMWVA